MPKDMLLDLSSPTPRLSSYRFFLTLVLKLNLIAELVDVDTAFTYSKPHTIIYALLPDGLYEDGRLDGKCCHLLRTLYGADAAPRMFHDLLHNYFLSAGFSICPHEPTLYFKWEDGVPVLALVHVDDCLLASSRSMLDHFKQEIRKMFNIKELGELGKSEKASLYLGMEITRTPDNAQFHLKQRHLIDQILSRVGNDITSVPHEKVPIRDMRLDHSTCPTTPEEKLRWKAKPYRSLLGIVGYLFLNTRSDCSFAYGQLSRFNENYGQAHWSALVSLASYLKKTRDTHFLILSAHGGWNFCTYCDSDYNGTGNCQSTTGFITFFGISPISWASRLQRSTSRSTAEAEYIALSAAAQESVYIAMLAESLRVPRAVVEMYCNDRSRMIEDSDDTSNPTWRTAFQVWTDSEAALAQANKPENWVIDKLRHIRTAYHFFKQYVKRGVIRFASVSGKDNPADCYTKGFGAPGRTATNNRADVFQRHAMFCLGHR